MDRLVNIMACAGAGPQCGFCGWYVTKWCSWARTGGRANLLAAMREIVIIFDMSLVTSPPVQPELAADLARRLGVILAALAAVVARRFLKDPKFFALIIPLWSWLGRSGRRFGRVKVQPPVAVPVPVPVRAVTPLVTKVRVRGVRLPSRRGWLVRALGYEAAGYGCQL